MSIESMHPRHGKPQERRAPPRGWLLALLSAAAWALGCAPLDTLQPGTCGNGVVEPANGEDCEPHEGGDAEASGHACGMPGTAEACRYSCTLVGVSGTGGGAAAHLPTCPEGYGCGLDGLCRRGKVGALRSGVRVDGREAAALYFGDFDGDWHADLLVDTTTGNAVQYGAPDGGFEVTTPLPGAEGLVPGQLARTPVTGAMATDIAIFGLGLMVGRGQSDRSIQPTIYAPLLLPNPDRPTYIVSVDAMPDTSSNGTSEWAGDEPAILVGDRLETLTDASLSFSLSAVNGELAEVLGRVRTGSIVEQIPTGNPNNPFESSPCDDLAVAFKGSGKIHIITPCRMGLGGVDWNQSPQGKAIHTFDPVVLPPGRILADGFLLADLNGDDHLDLLIGATDGDQDPGGEGVGAAVYVYVIYGVGNGTFDSHPNAVPDMNTAGDGVVSEVTSFLVHTLPLDVGDLNGDGQVDLVMPDGVLLSHAPGPVVPPLPIGSIDYDKTPATTDSPSDSWQEARVGDFNANGFADVVATTGVDLGLVFFNGDGHGLFTRYTLPLGGPASLLAVGDYDGDMIPDVAFREAGPHGDLPPEVLLGDSLTVAYGNPNGSLSAPQSMGRLARIEQVAPSSLSTGVLDGAQDVLVLTRSEDSSALSIAMLWGSSDRLLIAPYYLRDPDDSDAISRPTAVAVGQFDGDAAGHLDVAEVTMPYGNASPPTGGTARAAQAGRLWLLPATGEASIDASKVTPSMGLPLDFAFDEPLMAAVDLDGDGIDELALLSMWAGNPDLDAPGGLLVARRDGPEDQSQWTVDANTIQAMPLLFAQNRKGVIGGDVGTASKGDGGGGGSGQGGYDFDTGERYRGQIDVRDVDGDGHADVLALGLTMAGGAPQTQIVVLPNHGDGNLDAAQAVPLALPGDGQPTAFAWLSPSNSKTPTLLVLTANGAVAGTVDLTNGALADPVELLADNQKPVAGYRVATGDIDADGVLDLAIAQPDEVVVLLGVPEIP